MQVTENLSSTTSRSNNNRFIEWQAWAKVIVLFGLGFYFTTNIINGNLTNYVNVRFAWLSYVAVAILFLLGFAALYGIWRGDKTQTVNVGHQLNVSWGVIAISALPLLFGTLIPSQPLGAEAIRGNISMSAANFNTATAFQREPVERNVLEWVRVFNQDVPAAFDGEPADVIGFIYREPDYAPDHFVVARFTMSCCVADASAIGVAVYFDGADDIADGEWVRVSGDFLAGTFRGTATPILQATVVDIVDQPEHPYLYP